MNERYEIFARRDPQEPLARVGTVSVGEGESVEAAAKREHGEDWLEMVAIPGSGMTWAIRDDT